MELADAERGHRYWTYTVWPIPDDQGRPAGLVLLVSDTTAHHRDEQAVVDTRAVNEQLLMPACGSRSWRNSSSANSRS